MADCYLPSVVQGCSWSRTVTWDDASGNPVDVSGYYARLQFRKGSALALELSSPSAGITIGDTNGQVTLAMTPGQTEDLDPGTLDFDLILTSSAGVVSRLLVGALAVLPAVTHD